MPTTQSHKGGSRRNTLSEMASCRAQDTFAPSVILHGGHRQPHFTSEVTEA